MRILSIETAHPSGSLALAESGEIVAFRSLQPPLRTTESFTELIDQMLKQAGWPAASIQLVATTRGPGSFTGCRIGITAAKVYAYATGAAVIGVNTLELMAFQATVKGSLWVVMDAQRNQSFVAKFRKHGERLELSLPTSIVHDREWMQSLASGAQVTGVGLRKFVDRIPNDVVVTHPSQWPPRADALAVLAWTRFERGARDDVWQLTPNYYRKSAAEEKADAAGKV